MKALFITAPGKTEVRDIPKPPPAAGEVLLRVRLVGYCGSDLNTFRGKNPMVTLPRIPGHEIAATVEEAGTGVPPEFKPGTNVTLSPYTSCGTCPSCLRNRPNACQFNQTLGVQRDGALTEHIVVPWRKLYRSDKLSLRELAVVEPLVAPATRLANHPLLALPVNDGPRLSIESRHLGQAPAFDSICCQSPAI